MTTEADKQKFEELSSKAIEYKHKINTAKTNVKKELYAKKLTKTQQQVYQMLFKMAASDPSLLRKIKGEQTDEQ